MRSERGKDGHDNCCGRDDIVIEQRSGRGRGSGTGGTVIVCNIVTVLCGMRQRLFKLVNVAK